MNTPTTTTAESPPGPSRAGRRWAYTGTVLGAVTSVAANIADAYVAPHGWHPPRPDATWTPDPGAVLGAVFWPLALLAASETLAHKRWANPVTRRVGVGAVLVVALAAAVISYQHMHALLQHYQESDLSAVIGPLAIDGLMIVCSLALVARDATEPAEGTGQGSGRDSGTADLVPSSPTVPDTGTGTATGAGEAGKPAARKASRPRTGKPAAGSDIAARAARLKARHPDLRQADIAAQLGITERTLRRHLNPPTDPSTSTSTDLTDSTQTDSTGADAAPGVESRAA